MSRIQVATEYKCLAEADGSVAIDAGAVKLYFTNDEAAVRFLISESIRLKFENRRSSTMASIRRDFERWGYPQSAVMVRYFLVRLIAEKKVTMARKDNGRREYLHRPEWAEEVWARAEKQVDGTIDVAHQETSEPPK